MVKSREHATIKTLMTSWKKYKLFGSFNATIQFWFLPFDVKAF